MGLVLALLLGLAAPEGAAAVPRFTARAWLLDRLAEATVVPPLLAEYKGPWSRDVVQEMWHGDPAGNRHPWRRRVVVRERERALRDSRDALLLPAGSTLTLPLVPCPGGRLAFTLAGLREGGKEGAFPVTLSLGGAVILRTDLPARALSRTAAWPPETLLSLGTATGPLALSVGGEKGRDWLAWATPRLECPAAPAEAARPNVVYIVVDAMRGDVAGAGRRWGAPSITPHVDRLEASGATFPQGYANGNTTLLSMNAMLFGAHPRALGFLVTFWSGADRRPLFYRRPPPYLTRLLRAAGYLSWGATHNHLFFPSYKWGVDPGFEVLQDSGKNTDDAPILTQLAVGFLEAHRDRPFLLELNLLAPHQPYDPPKEVLEEVSAALQGVKDLPAPLAYLGEVAWADRHVGILLDALERLGLRDRTLVILTADHGEVMDPLHACTDPSSGKRCLQSHGLTLYEEEIRVPLILSLPGVIPPGTVRGEIGQHVDLGPTVLELLGLPVPSSMTGRSLRPAVTGGPLMPAVAVFAERWVSRTLREGRWKLIHHARKDGICPPVAKAVCRPGGPWSELYDLEADPRERREVSREHPEVARQLLERLEAFRMDLYRRSGGEGPNP